MSYARLSSPPPIEANRSLNYPPLSQGNHHHFDMQQPQPKPGGFFAPMYPSKPSKMSSTRRRRLLLSYLPDWLITVILAAGFFALDKINGYRREFSLTDTSLRYPLTEHEIVPNLHLIGIAVGLPIVLQPIINFFTVRSWWDLHNSYLGLILGLALTGSTTQLVKLTVGRPRPDIISRCIPPPGAVDPEFGLTTWRICTQVDDDILKEGFRSFPSGHSSLSFAGLGFLSYYIAGKLHLFDKRGHAGKAWLAITPFFGAALVAVSRSMDYRHHWHDILVGSLLGTIFAFFSYRQYYPPLSSEVSHRPYSPRIKEKSDESNILPTHMATANTSGFNASPPNQYSPPKFSSGSGMVNSEPYETVQLGVDGTVQRPGPNSMEDVWNQGGSGYDGTIPRSLSAAGGQGEGGGSDAGHSTRILSRREQQQQQIFQQQQQSHSDHSSPDPNDGYSIPLKSTSQHGHSQPHSRQGSQQRQYTSDPYTGIQ